MVRFFYVTFALQFILYMLYPNQIDTLDSLYNVANSATAFLTADISSSSTVIPLSTTYKFPSGRFLLSIETELIILSETLFGITNGSLFKSHIWTLTVGFKQFIIYDVNFELKYAKYDSIFLYSLGKIEDPPTSKTQFSGKYLKDGPFEPEAE